MKRPSVPAEALAQLLARQAIHDALVRYAIGLDRADEEMLASAFWPTAWCEYGTYTGPVGKFIGHVKASLGMFAATAHSIGNVLVEFDGQRACSQAYFQAYHGFPDRAPVWLGGRYLDVFECRGGDWRIVRRRFLLDWHDAAPGAEELFPASVSRRLPGRRKPDDDWYAFLEAFRSGEAESTA